MNPLISSLLSLLSVLTSAAEIYLAQGQLAGEATETSVLVQTRLTATPGLDEEGDVPGAGGVACFEWSRNSDFRNANRTEWRKAGAEHDFIIRAELNGLEPGAEFHYRVLFGEDEGSARPGPTGRFRTLPGAARQDEVRFIMGSCMNYHPFMAGTSDGGGRPSATEQDKQLGYPAFAAIAKLKPDFFIGAGDIVYYDKGKPFATTWPAMRKKWHEQFRFPRLVEFLANTPAYWLKDDHDFRYNDADRAGAKEPATDLGIRVFREQMPILPQGDGISGTYRTRRVNRALQLWFLEGRDYRTPNAAPDGPEKTIWGANQRGWLEQTLKESNATWKLLITSTPLLGPDDARKKDNHANLDGFRHERDTFFAWLKTHSITNVFALTGDRHWQYHSIHPSGVEEFSCGALNDENSRMGVKPGKGSDPQGEIRQPWTYGEPTGGFLMVTVSPIGAIGSALKIGFRDDTGKLAYEVTKSWP